MRRIAPVVILLAACAPRLSPHGYEPVDGRSATCFVMRERRDTLPTSDLRTPSLRVLLEQYAQPDVGRGTMWFFTDSTPPRRLWWGGWSRRGADTVEIDTGTYPSTHYRLALDTSGRLSGRGVMTSDAGTNGHFPTHVWAAWLEPISCGVLSG